MRRRRPRPDSSPAEVVAIYERAKASSGGDRAAEDAYLARYGLDVIDCIRARRRLRGALVGRADYRDRLTPITPLLNGERHG